MRRNVRLSIEEQTEPGGNFGDEPPETWEPFESTPTEWFSLTPLGGREYEIAQRMEAGTTHKARCKWFEGANSRLRLTDGIRIFNVQSVVNWEERNRFLDWQLEEVNA